MTIAARIQKRLDALGMNRAEASKAAGLSPTYIRDVMAGRVLNPRTEHLARLAVVLNTTLEWLAEGRGGESGGSADAARVLRIWDRIAPEDQDHALRALRGFVRDEDDEAAQKTSAEKGRRKSGE